MTNMDTVVVKKHNNPGISLSTGITDEIFVNLIKGYEVVLYKMAFQYVRNEHDALEMVSETVYKAYKNKKSLKNVEHFRTWITKILINTCLSYLKQNKRAVFYGKELTEYMEAPAPQYSGEDAILLDEALSCLKHEYKTVLLLRFYQDLSVKEVAKIMGVPKNTVKTYTSRALTELRKFLKEDMFYE